MLKIALLVNHFPPEYLGGTEIAAKDLAKNLADLGNEIHVVTAGKKESCTFCNDGFTVHYVGRDDKIPIFSSLLLLIDIFIIIRRLKPDLIHSQSYIFAWIGASMSRFFKIPHVAWGQGSDIYSEYRFKEIILEYVGNGTDVFLALSEDMASKLRSMISKPIRIMIMPNGIDISRFQVDSRMDVHQEIDINYKKIIYVGTLRPVKNVSVLIQAFALVRERIPSSRLTIVGDGIEKSRLESLVRDLKIQDFVTFQGRVENEELPKYLRKADVFVLPSKFEGFGIVVIEAMASGLPVVVTKVGGLSEIIEDGENGFLIDPEDSKQIADSIEIVLTNQEMRDKMGENNRQKAMSYDSKKIAARIFSIYETIVPKNH